MEEGEATLAWEREGGEQVTQGNLGWGSRRRRNRGRRWYETRKTTIFLARLKAAISLELGIATPPNS